MTRADTPSSLDAATAENSGEMTATACLNAMLDEALTQTYPASDPVAIAIPPAPERATRSIAKENIMSDPTPALQTTAESRRQDANAVAEALNGILADSFALYLETKNFHWHMSGPHFRDYHLLLDEQAAQILATTDVIAERVRKSGATTLRSIGDIARRQTIKDNDAAFVSANDMLAELHEDNMALVAALREAKEIVDEAKDNATSGVLDDWTDQAEGRAWFLSETRRTS